MKTFFLEIIQNPWTAPLGLEVNTDLADPDELLDFLRAKIDSDAAFSESQLRLLTGEEWESFGFSSLPNQTDLTHY